MEHAPASRAEHPAETPLTDSGELALRRTARTVRRQLLMRLAFIQTFGGLVVFGYLSLRFPASKAFDTPWVNDALLVIGFDLLVGPLVWLWSAFQFGHRTRWALVGRAPTSVERTRVLLEPLRMSAWPFLTWIGAAALVAAGIGIRRTLNPAETIDIVQTMLIGGLATCGVTYLVIEVTYRPLFAFALAGEAPDRPTSLGVRPRILLAYLASAGAALLGVSLSQFGEGTSAIATAALGGIGAVTGLFALWVAAQSIANPLDDLRDALRRVALGDLDVGLIVNDGGEVGQVQAGFNQMVAGLRERHRIQDLFTRHVGQAVADRAIEVGSDLGGESRRASMLFVDIIGSTAMAEVLPPGEVVANLNAFFGTVVDVVTEHGGWVNKFEGDGALCVFGVPAFQPDHEARALRAARELQLRLVELRAEHPGLDAGIGVSTGVVVAGNVGAKDRFEYTVIGRPVNEAARLTDLAKRRPGRALATAATVKAAGMERQNWAGRGRVGIRGQQAPSEIYELASPLDAPPRSDQPESDEWSRASEAS